MEKMSFKNIIVGFGKGGKTLAKFLAQKGESVAVIEESTRMYGGTCVNIGCIPSKSLIVNRQKGLKFSDAARKKADLTGKLRQKNYSMIADEATATVLDGKARFISDTEIEISANDKVSWILEGERIFINTGAKPIVPSIKGLSESGNIVTSTELMDLTVLPATLVIIGSGYIGIEFASMFASYGSKVIVLNVSDNFLPHEDEDIAERIKEDLESAGVAFKLGVKIEQVSDREDKTEIKITEKDGKAVILSADKVLIATGRKANTEGLGLENTSVALNERGEIVVNEKLETTAPNIRAIGDAHGGLQFTYTSLDDFRIIQSQLYGDGARTLNNRGSVPNSVFITPTLSSVGFTEKTAKAEGLDYRLFRLEAAGIPKSAVLGQSKGLLKALVDKKTQEILGATIYAEDSHEVINLLNLAIKARLPYTMLRDQIFTHPTMSEALNDLFAAANEVLI